MNRGWLALTIVFASLSQAQAPDTLPFAVGERLTYGVRTSKFGAGGRAVMSVTGPVDVRGTETMLATFDVHVRWAFMSGDDNTKSWIDPRRMASLRFEKHERRPFSFNNESVEIAPEDRRWNSTRGDSGTTASGAPLDELSFIYFLRTITLLPDSVYSFDRHYDARRTPTTVRIIKRETLTTPAGEFRTVELEMRVKDVTNYNGEGVLHLWISDDRCRLPVRIESTMALLGTGVLMLESVVTPRCPRGDSPTPVWSNRP